MKTFFWLESKLVFQGNKIVYRDKCNCGKKCVNTPLNLCYNTKMSFWGYPTWFYENRDHHKYKEENLNEFYGYPPITGSGGWKIPGNKTGRKMWYLSYIYIPHKGYTSAAYFYDGGKWIDRSKGLPTNLFEKNYNNYAYRYAYYDNTDEGSIGLFYWGITPTPGKYAYMQELNWDNGSWVKGEKIVGGTTIQFYLPPTKNYKPKEFAIYYFDDDKGKFILWWNGNKITIPAIKQFALKKVAAPGSISVVGYEVVEKELFVAYKYGYTGTSGVNQHGVIIISYFKGGWKEVSPAFESPNTEKIRVSGFSVKTIKGKLVWVVASDINGLSLYINNWTEIKTGSDKYCEITGKYILVGQSGSQYVYDFKTKQVYQIPGTVTPPQTLHWIN